MKTTLLNRMRQLTEEQAYRELYRDQLTGLLNRTAFHLDDSRFLALVDLDSLKFVNDEQGYRAGDDYIKTMAELLVTNFGADQTYRLNGDEFVVCESNARRLHSRLTNLQNQYPIFSFGIGTDLSKADALLRLDKKAREDCGKRAKRGEMPPWLT